MVPEFFKDLIRKVQRFIRLGSIIGTLVGSIP